MSRVRSTRALLAQYSNYPSVPGEPFVLYPNENCSHSFFHDHRSEVHTKETWNGREFDDPPTPTSTTDTKPDEN